MSIDAPAEDLTELMRDLSHTPPSMIYNMSNSELMAAIMEGPLRFEGIPNHTQAVERVVQLSSKTGSKAETDRKRQILDVAKLRESKRMRK
ncbi:hypothetical protein Ciccas_000342 [Cichlidogyrus casuarinus]|uniref:Uncharacterized protein n=1 Tax=Cichlidogyrus casuarinus TaxID=1844966 RepID=A0ABD2QNK7_9PLAT